MSNTCPECRLIEGCHVSGCSQDPDPVPVPHYATAIDAAVALRAESGDMFATAAELEMLKQDPDYLRQVLEGYHNVSLVVDEYAAAERAEQEQAAADLAERNANAACPDGYKVVTSGTIKAGDFVWNKADGAFLVYNYDMPEMFAEMLFLVCRQMTVAELDAAPAAAAAPITSETRSYFEVSTIDDQGRTWATDQERPETIEAAREQVKRNRAESNAIKDGVDRAFWAGQTYAIQRITKTTETIEVDRPAECHFCDKPAVPGEHSYGFPYCGECQSNDDCDHTDSRICQGLGH